MVIVNVFIKIINSLFGVIGSIINILLMALPTTPFNITLPAELREIIGKANYFIPVSQMINIANAWLVGIGLFYAYSVYARWAKTIQ